MNSIAELKSFVSLHLGAFAKFEVTDVSYYPTEPVQERVKEMIYGHHEMGHVYTSKWKNEERHVFFDRPLGNHCPAEGIFLLFLPPDRPAYGMMHLRRLLHKSRTDINLSIVSPLAVAPHLLHLEDWGNDISFYVVDEEGSKWSIHCAPTK